MTLLAIFVHLFAVVRVYGSRLSLLNDGFNGVLNEQMRRESKDILIDAIDEGLRSKEEPAQTAKTINKLKKKPQSKGQAPPESAARGPHGQNDWAEETDEPFVSPERLVFNEEKVAAAERAQKNTYGKASAEPAVPPSMPVEEPFMSPERLAFQEEKSDANKASKLRSEERQGATEKLVEVSKSKHVNEGSQRKSNLTAMNVVSNTSRKPSPSRKEPEQKLEKLAMVYLHSMWAKTKEDLGFNGEMRIKGYLPLSKTGMPLYIWLTGGNGRPFGQHSDMVFAKEMALRGYVAAQVEYPNSLHKFTSGTCADLKRLAEPIFSGEDSALERLCSLRRVDCRKGIAVHAWSDGADVAELGEQLNPRVSAMLLYGHGDTHNIGGRWLAKDCFHYTFKDRRMSNQKRRLIVSSRDEMRVNMFSSYSAQQAVSGYDCGKERDCLQPDGSGYYMTDGSEYGKRKYFAAIGQLAPTPHHCFFYETGCEGDFSRQFQESSSPWALKAGLDWLAKAARVEGS